MAGLVTYHCLCDRCKRQVEVTPTNANRMLHVVCRGTTRNPHKPQKMRHIGFTPYGG